MGVDMGADESVGVGVGPWQGNWPDDPRFDAELLAAAMHAGK